MLRNFSSKISWKSVARKGREIIWRKFDKWKSGSKKINMFMDGEVTGKIKKWPLSKDRSDFTNTLVFSWEV